MSSRCIALVCILLGLPIVDGVAAAVAQSGAASEGADRSARTAWGDPDIRGTYIRAHGAAQSACDTPHGGMIVVPPLYHGVTRIQQLPGYVIIRNQFNRHARVVPLDDGTAGTAGVEASPSSARWQGRWDADTLVVFSDEASGGGLTHGAAEWVHAFGRDVEVSERLTRVDAATLAYDATAHDSSGKPVATVSLTLRRIGASAPPHRAPCVSAAGP